MHISSPSSLRQLLLPALLLGTLVGHAQAGGVRIGTAGTPDASAVLDIVSSNKGVLLPRVADVTAIASPAAGLIAYQTGGTAGFYCYTGGAWQPLAAAGTAASPTVGDVKQGLQTTDHAGWVKLDGRSTSSLPSTQQTRATALGIGANLPNATGRVLKQTSGNLLATGGGNTALIDQTNLPNVSLSGSTSTGGGHSHTYWPGYQQNYLSGTAYSNVRYNYATEATNGGIKVIYPNYSTSASGDHSHTVTVPLGGSGTALPVEDAYLGVNQFVYLGQ